jgi:hypothetical protein
MKRGLVFIAVIMGVFISSPAHADGDGTYAVLDSNNNITNIIVCGSACSGGSFGGQKVVLQVPTVPSGQSQYGYFGSYSPNTNTFITPQVLTPITNSQSTTVVNQETGSSITTSLSATVNKSNGFTAPKSLNDPLPVLKPITTGAQISANQKTLDDQGHTVLVGSESAFLPSDLTSQQILETVSGMTGQPILSSHSQAFLHLLIVMGY